MRYRQYFASAMLLIISLCGLLLTACGEAPTIGSTPVPDTATAQAEPTTTTAPLGASAAATSTPTEPTATETVPAASAAVTTTSQLSELVYMWPNPLPEGLQINTDQSSADEAAFELTLIDPMNVQNQVFISGGAAVRKPPQVSSRPITVRGQNGVAFTTGAGYAVYWEEQNQPYTVGGFLLSVDGAAAIAETLEPLSLMTWRDRLTVEQPGTSIEPSPAAVVERCAVSRELKGNVNVSFEPFCVVWTDEVANERGFRIDLDYDGGEHFSYQASPNETQFVMPPEDAPRTSESRDLCQRRGSFSITVTALLPEGEAIVGGMGLQSECMMGFAAETP